MTPNYTFSGRWAKTPEKQSYFPEGQLFSRMFIITSDYVIRRPGFYRAGWRWRSRFAAHESSRTTGAGMT